MENIVFCLKLIIRVSGVSLAYVVRQHVKVAHISSGYFASLNLAEQMIARAPIDETKSNPKQTHDYLNRAYVIWQCDVFKINNALVYYILSKVFMDTEAYVYMKKGRECRTVELFSSTSIHSFLAPKLFL